MIPRSSKRFATLTINGRKPREPKTSIKRSRFIPTTIVMPPNAPSATTKEAIRKIWKDLLTDANISWKRKNVEVTQSGDPAFSSGTYEVTLNYPTGTPVNDRGKYLEVWKKQADGKWKCVADAWNFRSSCASGSCREEVGANCGGGRVGREFTCVTERSLDSHLS